MDKIQIDNVNLYYDGYQALKNVTMNVKKNEILGVIGPANSGKSSLLRAINRLYEIDYARMTGMITLDGENIHKLSLNDLRRRVGLIFATPVVLPGTIYKNIGYGPKLHNKISTETLDDLVVKALKAGNLWDEVKDRLKDSAATLSGGQQQRLCIARTLAMEPEVIMMDEPCSGLDPISTAKIEATMLDLKEQYTFILVTNNTKQAARVADRTAFFYAGELIEIDKTEKIFTHPRCSQTDDYIRGKFG
ncbi:phosphate ABC transporter ATP-binding protein [candidate division WOR_3 bacterium SM23_60]|uniref:Phosphate ABC transporter ATP-binding protein n=1 Tax=candidate division WOR_3 bacterium SM23_60 TaxID=1703780 RepID=A0A0S8GP77_UNCW3|nr:MAG: phosphate ABC transporter ATP-binding protein [candidate division WOR_3 bacterium SM23_60]